MRSCFALLIIICCSFTLSACQPSASGSADLREYVASIKNRPPQPLPPLPKFKSVSQFVYSASNLRDPFQAIPTSLPGGDPRQAKEQLENFPLDSLRMIGILLEQGKQWALILAPDGKTYQVTIGSHIGQNYGRVVTISANAIEIKETIHSGEEWKSRIAELKLSSSGGGKNS